MKKSLMIILASGLLCFPYEVFGLGASNPAGDVPVFVDKVNILEKTESITGISKAGAEIDYVEVNVETPGTLGDLLLEKVETLSEIEYLRISGTLDDSDWSRFSLMKSNLKELDLSGLNNTLLPTGQFYSFKIQKIWLPSSLKEIEGQCFWYCGELTFVSLPNTLEVIGGYCFAYCRKLEEIEFPQSLKTIQNNAFSEVPLKKVNLPQGLVELDQYAFYNNGALEQIEIPDGLKEIRSNCFGSCRNLRSIKFGNGVEHLFSRAFSNCAVESLEFPNSLKYIDNNVFDYCGSLSSIQFNEGLLNIGGNAFRDCKALTEVELPSSLVMAVGSPFDFCENLRKITCKSIEPPFMTAPISFNTGMEGRELYVPEFSIRNYKLDNAWGMFENIKSIDFYPANITVLREMELTLTDNIPEGYSPGIDLISLSSDKKYGKLTVNGDKSLNLSNFSTCWGLYDRWYHGNYNCYGLLMNNAELKSDSVSVICQLCANAWNFISFPFDVKVDDIESLDNDRHWVIRGYSGENRAAGLLEKTWVKMTSDSILKAGHGYIMQGYRSMSHSSDHRFRMKSIDNDKKNNIFISADVEVELSEFPGEYSHNSGWNFIGNPYPCYYDTRFIEFEAPITVKDWSTGTYKAYSLVDDSYILCPGEPFFVQCPVEDHLLVFGSEGRQLDMDVREIGATRRSLSKKIGIERTLINVVVSGNNRHDETRVVINDDAYKGYELHCDAVKFKAEEDDCLQMYSRELDVDYAINERPLSDGVVNLCVDLPADGSYNIALREYVSGYDVNLVDKFTGKIRDLNESDPYEFYSEKGEILDRFVLIVSRAGESVVNNIMEECHNEDIYTITGQKAQLPLQPGLYIKSGKKFIVK